jgi:hypothetical protein
MIGRIKNKELERIRKKAVGYFKILSGHSLRGGRRKAGNTFHDRDSSCALPKTGSEASIPEPTFSITPNIQIYFNGRRKVFFFCLNK